MHSFDFYKNYINDNLTKYIPELNQYSKTVADAMKYSLEIGGKRLRPVLLLASCEFGGGNINEALPYACALEYIHTYSLIHDDLPAMDNDDLRRGKPSNHKVYGEAMAILAGDGLLNTAAEIVISSALKYCESSEKMAGFLKAAYEIMHRAGLEGMIGGQVADVENEYNDADAKLVEYIELHKTADLLTAAIIAGLYIAGADDSVIYHFSEYAQNLGIAFQILDDILDFEGDPELMGKNVGKDKDLGKCNYACVHGIDKAKAQLHELTNNAKMSLKQYGEDASFFIELADKLEYRRV